MNPLQREDKIVEKLQQFWPVILPVTPIFQQMPNLNTSLNVGPTVNIEAAVDPDIGNVEEALLTLLRKELAKHLVLEISSHNNGLKDELTVEYLERFRSALHRGHKPQKGVVLASHEQLDRLASKYMLPSAGFYKPLEKHLAGFHGVDYVSFESLSLTKKDLKDVYENVYFLPHDSVVYNVENVVFSSRRDVLGQSIIQGVVTIRSVPLKTNHPLTRRMYVMTE